MFGNMLLSSGGFLQPEVAGTPVSTTSNTASQTTHVINLPSDIVAGELLLVFARGFGGTQSAPTGWTILSTSDAFTYLLYKIADGTEGSTFTETGTNWVSPGWFTIAYRIAKVTSSPRIAQSSFNTYTGIPDPPSLTSGFGITPTLWIAYGWISGGSGTMHVNSWPANYTDGQISVTLDSVTAHGIQATAARKLTAATENPPPFVTDVNDKISIGWTVAIAS